MPSTTSSCKGWFNPTLLTKNITRFWPIWGLYTAILFFLLPVEIIMDGSHGARGLFHSFAEFATMAMPVLGLFFGLFAAMALFSYLMTPRSCQMFHALPIRREGLFLTNWLSSLWFFLVPALVIFLISLLLEVMYGAPDLAGLGLWLISACACPMFFFCLALCVAMFTGHILALPVLYGILNGLVAGVALLLDFAGNRLLYNYSGHDLIDATVTRWCTPVWQLYHLLSGDSSAAGYFSFDSVVAAAGYSVSLGAVFTLIALAAYRLRQLERAGDVITVGWARPVFQLGLGACLGLSLGLMIYQNFFYSFGAWAYIICVAVCAVIGSFAGRMLLKKTLRVFSDAWKSSLALGVVIILLMAGVRADWFGFQRWTPDPARVASVSVSGLRSYPEDDAWYSDFFLEDPEQIARVVDIHRSLNAQFSRLVSADDDVVYQVDEDGCETENTVNLRLTYHMTDGSTVSRNYPTIPITAQDLADSGTYAAKLETFLNDPQLLSTNYLAGRIWDAQSNNAQIRATGGWISLVSPEEEKGLTENASVEIIPPAPADEPAFQQVPATESKSYAEQDLDFQAAQLLWSAFQEDLAAGRVRRYLLDSRERKENCFYSDITITLGWSTLNEEGDRSSTTFDLTFTPQWSQTSVMAALEQLGYLDRLSTRPVYRG